MEIRPEHFAHGGQAEINLKGEAVLVEPLGPTNLISVKVGENELKMFLACLPSARERLSLSFSSSNAFFFDAQSGLRLNPNLER